MGSSCISRSIYHRMIFIGCLEAIVMLPVSIAFIIPYCIASPNSFYQGWGGEASVNSSRIPTVLSSDWRSNTLMTETYEWDLWINPFTACVFFATFGLTRKARETYQEWLWNLLVPCGIRRRIKSQDKM